MKKLICAIIVIIMVITFTVNIYAEMIPSELFPLPISTEPEHLIYMHLYIWDSDIGDGTIRCVYTELPCLEYDTHYAQTYKDSEGVWHQSDWELFIYNTVSEKWSKNGTTVRDSSHTITKDCTIYLINSTPMLTSINLVDDIAGTGTTPENPTIFDYFAGINFDYEGFLGKVGVKLEAKKDGQESYVPIQEWEYPEGEGTVNIDSHDIAYYNNGDYRVTIYEGDRVVNTYYYIVNTTTEKQPYIDIIYPSNGFQYEYFPNINIEYFDMGDLRIYINEVLYKRISTTGKEGIEVVPGTHSLFQIGLNTIYVEDINSQTVATVQYMVMREGDDPTIIVEPEFDSDNWVRELYQRIMSEYSQFFIYIKNIYSFLPYEILGLVVIVIMLSVVLWFTGRK